jgi:hypothetical protein
MRMAKKKSNFDYNYPRLIKYLEKNGLYYEEFNSGLHLRVYGAIQATDIWPGRMTYHIIRSEEAVPTKYEGYNTLDFVFNEEQVDKLLNSYL